MRNLSFRSLTTTLAGLVGLILSCAPDERPPAELEVDPILSRQRAPLLIGGASTVTPTELTPELLRSPLRLPWGSDEGEIGWMPPASEHLAEVPNSLAVGPDGSLWLLDQVNQRLVHLAIDGAWIEAIPCPPGTSDLAVGPDGQLFAFSQINHLITVFADGEMAGSIETPLAMPMISRFQVTASGHVLLNNHHQNTYDIGRLGAPVGWPDTLHTRIDGTPGVSGGPPLKAILYEGGAALVDTSVGDRSPNVIPLTESSGAASVVLVDTEADGHAILLLEWLTETGVDRRLRRVDWHGVGTDEVSVPAPIAFPFRELAVVPNGPVYQLVPRLDGLHIIPHGLGRIQ